MELILTQEINDTLVDGYYDSNEAWFTRFQIGQALEYADPQHAITLIHNKHKDRLDKFSRKSQIETTSGVQNGFMYSIRGVFEICRWSKQPKADVVMDALYDMAEEVLRKGYYSILPDEQLVQVIQDRLKYNPEYLKSISDTVKSKAKADKAANREAGVKLMDELWTRYFDNREEFNMQQELRKIWMGDMPMYHKYLDKFHADERRAAKKLI